MIRVAVAVAAVAGAVPVAVLAWDLGQRCAGLLWGLA
jgi:hypothetical protein